MGWEGQNPLASDVIAVLRVDVPDRVTAWIEIDKLPHPTVSVYRATIGNLFQFRELCQTSDLEELLRRCRRAQEMKSEAHGVQLLKEISALILEAPAA